jgi:hypothetical protein
MKFFVRSAILPAAACAALAAICASGTFSIAREDQEVLDADRSLITLLERGDDASMNDQLALNRLLNEDFTWIDSNGRSLYKAQVMKSFPAPSNIGVELQERIYGKTAIVRANRGRIQVLRVWLKRASSWRLVLYQEVRMVVKSEPPASSEAGAGECDNPCKTIPFQPETPSEKDVIASWQGVMKAMAESDPDAYAPLIADEFTATDTHHDAPYTKAERLAQIKKQKQIGVRSTPPALLSARMFDFGDTVMMIAREQRANAKPYFNTRMWVKRDGRWQMLFSFNTRIE